MAVRRGKRPRRERGFTLLEVLVAVLVLSLGVLGLGQLQVVLTRSIHDGFLQEQAVALVYDMADRMRANEVGVNAGNYDSADGANYQAPADNNCTQGAGAPSDCTAAEMAAHDRFEWNQALAQILPAGAGAVCTDSDPSDATACDGAGAVYTISATWNERDGNTRTYAVRFR